MTNPPGPRHGDPTPWGRPGSQGPAGPPRPPVPPGDEPTRHIPRPSSPMDQPTQNIPRPGPGGGPPQQMPGAPPGPPPAPPPTTAAAGKPGPKRRPRLTDPLSIVLILVIVVALVAAGLIGAELYVRKSANDRIKVATTCETEDSEDTVSVSFSSSPPVLWQYLTDNYPKITVNTHGTHIRSAQGMTVDVVVDDVRLNGDSTRKGTIGAINATFTWTTNGILQSIRDGIKDSIPDWLSSFVSVDSLVTGVKTDPSAGTVTVEGISGSEIVVKPEIIQQPTNEFPDGGIRLTIQPDGFKIPGGFNFPRETLQSTLDEKTKKITENNLNIKPVPPVEIANDAVKLRFSTQNANIPLESTDPCFANL